MKRLGILALCALGTFVAPVVASADPIVGSVGFGGTVDPEPGGGIGGATGLVFVNAFVSAGTGDYSTLPGSSATFTDFTFDPFAGTVSPLWVVTAGGVTYSFDLESIAIEEHSSNFLVLSGTGTLHMDGKDDTAGTWRFTNNNAISGDLFTFSANTGVTEGGSEGEGAVPEPTTLLLLGMGMTGLASRYARRRQ